ncbi:MAG: hydrogenase iron-sulfur subunit, partial [Desulfobacteraceae bacterium]|jgi:heterodisulfide reductase subunit A-like polyferredoxin/coenzyme F420-reducing hydrogenase delta subunit|nr:hydrogenase iron-sulfur subunit [Desulfobacteraceae bacterium]
MTQELKMETINLATDVLVVGAGLTGVKAASEIAASGYRVVLIDEGAGLGMAAGASVADLDGEEQAALEALLETVNGSEMIDVMTGTRMDGAAGVPGDFRVWLSGNDDIVEKSVGAIVVASELVACSLNEAYGLRLSERVFSQSRMEAALAEDPAVFSGKTIAFMVGLAQDGSPLVLELVLKGVLAMENMEDTSAYVFAGDLKVAEDGLERLYLECRDKGAMYVKLTEMPALAQEGDALTITYDDPILQRKVQLSPDIIVVEEAIGADQVNRALAEMLGLDMGSMGFLQTDNVHRLPVSTNREGIFVVGGSRRVKKRYGALMDAENAAIRIRNLLGDGTITVPANKAVLDSGKCTFCLTCYRCCPHGAIYWSADNKPVISAVACQGCGICAAECPMDAIQIGDFNDAEMIDRVTQSATVRTGDSPTIVAFCCQNSGLEAARMAESFGMPLPKGLKTVAVPCAGKVDIDYVLHALAEGADGVVVMACHNGNCKSEKGSLYAGWRAANAQEMLTAIGLEKERICFATTASNMGADFSNILMAMEETLKFK